jgi:SAM-dependent methyltransferase
MTTSAVLLQALDSCPGCGSSGFRSLYTDAQNDVTTQLDAILFSMMGIPYQPVRYDLCGGCGLLFLNPRWNESALGLLYGEPSIYRRAAVERFRKRTGRLDATERDYFRFIDDTIDRPDRIHEGHRTRGAWVMRHMTDRSDAPSVADVGAGFGAARKALEHVGFTYQGFESSSQMVNLANELGRGVECVPFDGISASLKKPVDVVYTAQFLEHVNEPVKCLLTLRDIIRDNGFLFVDVPACQYLAMNWTSFLGTAGRRREYMNWGHMLQFDHISLSNTVLRAGFRPVATQYVGAAVWMVARKLPEAPAPDGYVPPNTANVELNVRVIDPLLKPVGDAYRKLRATAKRWITRRRPGDQPEHRA